MIDERKRLVCDCCARQILEHKCDDKFTVGPKVEAHIIGINLHCCGKCWPDYIELEKIRIQREFS